MQHQNKNYNGFEWCFKYSRYEVCFWDVFKASFPLEGASAELGSKVIRNGFGVGASRAASPAEIRADGTVNAYILPSHILNIIPISQKS